MKKIIFLLIIFLLANKVFANTNDTNNKDTFLIGFSVIEGSAIVNDDPPNSTENVAIGIDSAVNIFFGYHFKKFRTKLNSSSYNFSGFDEATATYLSFDYINKGYFAGGGFGSVHLENIPARFSESGLSLVFSNFGFTKSINKNWDISSTLVIASIEPFIIDNVSRSLALNQISIDIYYNFL